MPELHSGAVIGRFLDVIERAAAGPLGPRLGRTLASARNRLATDVLRIAVAGREGSGRTSLVEALLGRPLSRTGDRDDRTGSHRPIGTRHRLDHSTVPIDLLDTQPCDRVTLYDNLLGVDAVLYLYERVQELDESVLTWYSQALLGARSATAALQCLHTYLDLRQAEAGGPAKSLARSRRRHQDAGVHFGLAEYVLPNLAAAAVVGLDGSLLAAARTACSDNPDSILWDAVGPLGVRIAEQVTAARRTPHPDAAELRAAWLDASNLPRVHALIDHRLVPHREALRLAATAAELNRALTPLRASSEPATAAAAAELAEAIQHEVTGSVPLRRLRLHETLAEAGAEHGRVALPAPRLTELRQLIGADSTAAAVGLPDSAPVAVVRLELNHRIADWRTVAAAYDLDTSRHGSAVVALLEELSRAAS